MSNDLVKRLRNKVPHYSDPKFYCDWDLLSLEAADHIEELERKLGEEQRSRDAISVKSWEFRHRIEELERALRDVIAYADRRGDGWLDSLARFALDGDDDDE